MEIDRKRWVLRVVKEEKKNCRWRWREKNKGKKNLKMYKLPKNNPLYLLT